MAGAPCPCSDGLWARGGAREARSAGCIFTLRCCGGDCSRWGRDQGRRLTSIDCDAIPVNGAAPRQPIQVHLADSVALRSGQDRDHSAV